MKPTVKDLFDLVLPQFQGATIGLFQSPNSTVYSAVKNVLARVELVDLKKVVPLTPMMLNGEHLYPCPADLTNVIDISPAQGRNLTGLPDYQNTSNKSISLSANSKPKFAIDYRNGSKILHILSPLPTDTPITIHECDSLTTDGTVSTYGGAINLQLNTLNYINGIGALSFDITAGSTSSTVDILGMENKDLTTIKDSVLSLNLFVPTEKITNVKIELSDVADYASKLELSTATNSYGQSPTYGWNNINFVGSQAVITGTPVLTNIAYARVTLTTANNIDKIVGICIDAIMLSKGASFELSYYSNLVFRNQSGVYIEKPTDIGLTDSIMLDSDAINLVLQESIKLASQEVKGKEGADIWQIADRELNGVWGDYSRTGLYQKYEERHQSESTLISEFY